MPTMTVFQAETSIARSSNLLQNQRLVGELLIRNRFLFIELSSYKSFAFCDDMVKSTQNVIKIMNVLSTMACRR